jgi:hypothetical protein
MKIEMGKQYTCNGKPVRILCTDRPRGYPVVSMDEKTGDIEYFNENGKNPPFNNCNLVEDWEPQENEWCWFWDDMEHCNAHLRKYAEMYLELETKFFVSIDGCAWKYCAKFIGVLPEYLKDL